MLVGRGKKVYSQRKVLLHFIFHLQESKSSSIMSDHKYPQALFADTRLRMQVNANRVYVHGGAMPQQQSLPH